MRSPGIQHLGYSSSPDVPKSLGVERARLRHDSSPDIHLELLEASISLPRAKSSKTPVVHYARDYAEELGIAHSRIRELMKEKKTILQKNDELKAVQMRYETKMTRQSIRQRKHTRAYEMEIGASERRYRRLAGEKDEWKRRASDSGGIGTVAIIPVLIRGKGDDKKEYYSADERQQEDVAFDGCVHAHAAHRCMADAHEHDYDYEAEDEEDADLWSDDEITDLLRTAYGHTIGDPNVFLEQMCGGGGLKTRGRKRQRRRSSTPVHIEEEDATDPLLSAASAAAAHSGAEVEDYSSSKQREMEGISYGRIAKKGGRVSLPIGLPSITTPPIIGKKRHTLWVGTPPGAVTPLHMRTAMSSPTASSSTSDSLSTSPLPRGLALDTASGSFSDGGCIGGRRKGKPKMKKRRSQTPPLKLRGSGGLSPVSGSGASHFLQKGFDPITSDSLSPFTACEHPSSVRSVGSAISTLSSFEGDVGDVLPAPELSPVSGDEGPEHARHRRRQHAHAHCYDDFSFVRQYRGREKRPSLEDIRLFETIGGLIERSRQQREAVSGLKKEVSALMTEAGDWKRISREQHSATSKQMRFATDAMERQRDTIEDLQRLVRDLSQQLASRSEELVALNSTLALLKRQSGGLLSAETSTRELAIACGKVKRKEEEIEVMQEMQSAAEEHVEMCRIQARLLNDELEGLRRTVRQREASIRAMAIRLQSGSSACGFMCSKKLRPEELEEWVPEHLSKQRKI